MMFRPNPADARLGADRAVSRWLVRWPRVRTGERIMNYGSRTCQPRRWRECGCVGGVLKLLPASLLRLSVGRKEGRKLALELHLWSARQSGGWLLLPLGLVWGEGGVSGWTGGGGDRRGRRRGSKSICTRARKRSDARAKNSRADVPPVARAPAKRKSVQLCDGNPVKRTSSSAWRGPCGTEMSMGSAVAKESVRWSERVSSSCDPRQEWSAPSHRSRSPAAPDPLGPSRNSRPRKSHSRHRDPTYRCFRATRRAGWRPPRARTRPPTTERAYFALPSDCWSETDRNPPRAAPARTPSGSVLPPPLPTVAHHHSCFSLSFVPLAACRPGRARELSAHTGDGGWVREILTRKPFESPDVANLRRASSGRSPLRCGEVSLRAMRRGTLPATSVGIAAF